MKMPSLKSILAADAKKQDTISQKNRAEKIAKLPIELQNIVNQFRQTELRKLEQKEQENNNVIQVNFKGPRFYIPKTMAASKSSNTIENWYNKSHLYFDGLSIQLDIDADDIEVTIEINEPQMVSAEYHAYLNAKKGASVKFALFDGDIQLAELTGSVVGQTIIGAGLITRHEKLASGKDAFSLFFEE
jgi:hypothetical protein